KSILPTQCNIKTGPFGFSKTCIAETGIEPVFWCIEKCLESCRHISQYIRIGVEEKIKILLQRIVQSETESMCLYFSAAINNRGKYLPAGNINQGISSEEILILPPITININ